MSTKVSIKARRKGPAQPGFHLYEDCLDEWGHDHASDESPVYLELGGIAAELHTLATGGAWVRLALPRELACELVLVPPLGEGVAAIKSS